MRKGKFIVIEGLDGCGKSTQIDLLTSALHHKNINTLTIHFPRRSDKESPLWGTMIKKFLDGYYGNIDKVHPELVALLFAGDRYNAADEINTNLNSGNWIICDRYVLSNIAYQGAKLPYENWNSFAYWILKTEYEYFKIPKPDLQIILSMPFNFIENNLKIRKQNFEEDIHEQSMTFLKNVDKMYDWIIENIQDDIKTLRYNEIKNVNDIHKDIMQMIDTQYF